METYVRLVQKFENKCSDANRQFVKRLRISESDRYESRSLNVAEAVENLSTEADKRCKNITTKLPSVQNWWEIFAGKNYPEEECLKYLKCSRKTYICLVTILKSRTRKTMKESRERSNFDISKRNSVDRQVAATLCKLARRLDSVEISAMFGIPEADIYKTLYRVVEAINKHLLKNIIKIPKPPEAPLVSQQLEGMTMIPQLLGAIESNHIRMKMNDAPSFKNSKNYHSFVMQTVVDANCWDVSVRHPGAVDDEKILNDSSIYKHYHVVIPTDTLIIENIEIPYKIAADASYPMLPWLLTEYETAATPGEHCFNDHLRIARWCSNAAIARLKGRFEILSRSIDLGVKMAPQIIAACCVIHNICEYNQDPCLDEWLIESRKTDVQYPQPDRARDPRVPDPREIIMRDAIRDYVEARMLHQDSDPLATAHQFET